MLTTVVRAIGFIVMVCLLAASGMQPLRASGPARRGEHAQAGDQHPVLLAVTATRHATARVAPRATPRPRLPVFVVAAPPELPGHPARAIAGATRHGWHRDSTLLPIRSARGPPAR
jgi:hypothetical protein